MKNMMKITFDLQMDIQSLIRLEVAAGIAAAFGCAIDGTAGKVPTATAALSRPVNNTHCLICLDNYSDSVLYQCGHMCVCFPCGRHLMDRGAKCPSFIDMGSDVCIRSSTFIQDASEIVSRLFPDGLPGNVVNFHLIIDEVDEFNSWGWFRMRRKTPVGDSPLIAPLQSLPERRDSVSSQVTSATSSSTSLREFSNAPVDVRVQDPRGLLGSVLQHDNVPPPGLAIPTGPVVHEVNWHTIEEQQQEELIQEVSELLHRRLVTSTLQGEFRNILELHVQQQLAATGTDGQRVEQFIRSIPQTQPHQHNDFSNLGIPNQGENNWDNISVTSISASAVPYTQTNLHLSREISALKAQLLEMKNMMKNSFDLQMDIQRSIRQEVAAGIAAASGAIGSAGTEGILPTATAALSRPVNDTHCLICLDNHSDSVLYQCGHMCVCFPCGRHLMDRGAKCPVCRAPIRDIIRAYKCNSE
ncbi:uncharacterized protein LOC127840428 [Dreissena polymorpha]|uniref:uncharacterized protein LOC127840428 n=1 Tax=Dreissena polymorpha TaxID=45954 RepID=UPI0022646AAE|nr:uncharacterized protein LOC127840428 [Dreissena polymorpha]